MNYQTARIVLDIFHKARAMLDSGLTMRSIKEEFLRTQLVDVFPEGGVTVAIFDRLSVCRSKAKFTAAMDGITEDVVLPVFKAHERRMSEIRAYNEERAELTVDQAHDKALKQDSELTRYWLERSRPNDHVHLSEETRRKAIGYAHAEALELDKGWIPSIPTALKKRKTANVAPPPAPMPPAMPVAQMPPIAPAPTACIYVSGIGVGNVMELIYDVGTEDEARRVYVLLSPPVRVEATCYQIMRVKQLGDHREHRIAFNATTDSFRLYSEKEGE